MTMMIMMNILMMTMNIQKMINKMSYSVNYLKQINSNSFNFKLVPHLYEIVLKKEYKKQIYIYIFCMNSNFCIFIYISKCLFVFYIRGISLNVLCIHLFVFYSPRLETMMSLVRSKLDKKKTEFLVLQIQALFVKFNLYYIF